MSSAKVEQKEDSALAVLMSRVEQDQADLLPAFCQRVSKSELRLIESWNATDQLWSDDPCLHELLAAQALATPNAPAVICGDTVLSYRELNERANRIAARLLQYGVSQGEPIGLLADCSAEAILALVGILKAGCAYLPLDISLPEERRRYFLEDAAVRLVIGQPESQLWLAQSDVAYLSIADLPVASDDCLPQISAEGLAYVLYTSGSTGKAKGVMLNHRGPVNTIRDINQRFNITAADRVLALSSLGFDLSVYDLFGIFAAGAAVVQPTLVQVRDPHQWCRLIEQHEVSVWNTVPALMDMLVTYAGEQATCPSLRVVMLSGDWIPVALPNRIRAFAPNSQVYSLGGSTEASIWSVIYPIDTVEPEWRSIPYGGPMLNQRTYIIDTDLKLCPIGEAGELCLAGIGVAQGYLHRTELTAERFVPDPWDLQNVMYRTGDLCRYLPDGNLEFLGRRDHQVKIRGYRIGLGEIESEIERLPAVRDAAVIASEELTGARLIAYVVLNSKHELCLESLNKQLGLVLPEYMLPSALVLLPKLPLSSNGKVDRKQLPLPTLERATDQFQLATTTTEKVVSDILCKLLKLPQIDARDDFYALGGNSLLAVSLICQIRSTCGVELSIPEVLSRSLNTIELARRIDAATDSQPARALPRLTLSNERITRAPLSYCQQQLWVVNFLEEKRQRYNVPLVYDLRTTAVAERPSVQMPGEIKIESDSLNAGASSYEGLNAGAISYAFSRLIERHDILRTVYVAEGARLEQIVLPPAPLDVAQFDLRAHSLQERVAVFESRATEFLTRPFSLDAENPIRVAIYRLDEDHWRLVVAIHHIAVDGLSINIIQQELAEHYRSYVESGVVANLPVPSHQYANYAQWQLQHNPPESFQAEREYWRERLTGPLPVLDLPEDNLLDTSTEGETIYFELDNTLVESVTQFARESQVTPFITLLAAINAVLHRYTGQKDIVIGSPVSTRTDESTQALIGYFINVLPLRTRFDSQENFAELLGRVRETVLGALQHRHYPFELLKKELLSGQSTGQDPFRVMFVLEDEPESLTLSGLDCQVKAFDTRTAKFDLLIAAFVSAGRIRFELQYRKSCFNRQRIVAFGRHLQAMLSSLVASPEQALNQVEWLQTDEISLLHGAKAEQAISFLQRFDQQVEHFPNVIATSCAGQQLTYRQLDERSRALATHLQRLSVGPGERVGINIPRSLELVVAVLATLKVGAAYVPIDTTWPTKRKAQVLQDCQPAIVLTHSRLRDSWNDSQLVRIECDLFAYAEVDASDWRAVPIQPGSDAYILYTSGSTGQPKGVAMSHAGLDNLIAWQLKTTTVGAASKTLQFASIGFDVSFQEIFATLCSGGQLVLVTEEQQQDLNQLWKLIVSSGIERLFVPFVALRGLCEIAGNQAHQSKLVEVNTAGEQLLITPAIREFFSQLPGCKLWNQYGPTETHVVTALQLDKAAQQWPASPAIGLPIVNCDVVVLDKNYQPVPRGTLGELYLGGACLANGYFNNEPLTHERFSDLATSKFSGQRFYRTGDLGYINWDGQLQFVGRNDHQIKVRGHRVELSEIELALADCPGVQQAVVTVHNSGVATQLRAHLLTARCDVSVEQIVSQLSLVLPAYMMPQQFNLVEQFPKTASGKVDRLQLAKVEPNNKSVATESHLAPAVDVETIAKLKSIWQAVLQVEALSVDSNFFDCGGDSLAAAILFSKMEAEFGKSISIDTLVKCPTIGQLAELYRGSQPQVVDRWQNLVPLQPLGTQRPVICLAGIDGHFLNFRHMAGLLGEDRPMYGLQAVGLSGKDQPLTSINAIAADHVRTLRSAMPEGPYNLVGFSFGGIVAYEMSQILRREGEQVALALIDCSTGMPSKATLLQSLAFHFRYAKQLPAEKRWQYFMQRVYGYWLGIKFKLKLIDWERRLEGLIDVKGHYAHVAAVNMHALSSYHPAASLGSAVLYRASLRANWPGTDRTNPADSWSKLFTAGQFQVVDIEGAHANMLTRPNVDRLVEHLNSQLS